MSIYLKLTDKLHARETDNQILYLFWCVGCEQPHGIPVRKDPNDGVHPSWKFDGNLDFPTFIPSLLHPTKPVCHLHIKNGKIEYCGDCDHKLAGQTVDMVNYDI